MKRFGFSSPRAFLSTRAWCLPVGYRIPLCVCMYSSEQSTWFLYMVLCLHTMEHYKPWALLAAIGHGNRELHVKSAASKLYPINTHWAISADAEWVLAEQRKKGTEGISTLASEVTSSVIARLKCNQAEWGWHEAEAGLSRIIFQCLTTESLYKKES